MPRCAPCQHSFDTLYEYLLTYWIYSSTVFFNTCTIYEYAQYIGLVFGVYSYVLYKYEYCTCKCTYT